MAKVSPIRKGTEAVVLVVPPVLHPNMPPLGTSVLAPACVQAGVPTRVVEANVAFAAKVGFEFCGRIAASPPWKLLGEAIFLAAAYPERADEQPRVLEFLSQASGLGTIALPWEPLSEAEVSSCAEAVPGFISETVERVLAGSPRIVGLSAMGQQTLASIAIAREVKRLRPEVVTVLGGTNATEPMGSGILATTEAFDFAFSGEADLRFPEFCRTYLETGELPERRIVSCAPVADLDLVAEPDYDSYFAELELHRAYDPVADAGPANLLFESSRGCWWADKLTCKFCGYITPGTRYRVRSPEKIVTSIESLIERYGVRATRASDAIMAPHFSKNVLPLLIERGIDCSVAYEVKSNLKEAELDTFVRAGVTEVQPGIESLSSHVLGLMDKGVSALENVALLRNARSRGIEVIWNFLTAFPGEAREDYEAMIELIPLIEHLRAPVRWGPIHVSRFSPYHGDPARWKIENVRPFAVYTELFGKLADQVACNFDADYETGFTRDPDLVRRFDEVLARWTDSWQVQGDPPCLEAWPLDGGWVLVQDKRPIARAPWHLLTDVQVEAMESVRAPSRVESIRETNRALLEELVDRRLVALYEGRYLSLVSEPDVGLGLNAEREQILARSGG
ncbi:MAG: RiPP maturation radical SAM protein 1 [bacterium]|nr:RiPP maturation radical SAM protein 1 [bacterium]